MMYHCCGHRSFVVALLFGVCAEQAFALRLTDGVHSKSKKAAWGGFGKFDPAKRDVVVKALEKLEQLWPGGEKSKEMLSAAVVQGTSVSSDPGVLRRKLAKRMHEGKPFVFAAFGDSVTAGHDNFPNQSWPYELERILKPTFKALNFDIEIRQRGMGSYGEAPFTSGCLAERGGQGIDAMSWEWELYRDSECEKAMFMKEALTMESKPALFAMKEQILRYKVFGTWVDGHEDGRRDWRKKLFRNHDDKVNDEQGPHSWEPTYHPNEWYLSEDFVSQQEAQTYFNQVKDLKQVEPHLAAEKMEEAMPAWDVAQIAKQYGIEGFYPMDVTAGTKFIQNEPFYYARERAFQANWHPAPLGHTLIASQIAHFMLSQLKTEFEGMSLKESASVPGHQNPLVGSNAAALDHRCGTMQNQVCQNGVRPSSEAFSRFKKIRSPKSKDTWHLKQSRHQKGSVDSFTSWRGTTSSGQLQLEVNVPDSGEQYVMLCGAPCEYGQSCGGFVSVRAQRFWNPVFRQGDYPNLDLNQIGNKMGYIEGVPRKLVSDLEFRVDGVAVSTETLKELHDELFDMERGSYCPGCTNMADLCQPAAKLSPGKHTVGLLVKPSSYNDSNMFVDVLGLNLVA